LNAQKEFDGVAASELPNFFIISVTICMVFANFVVGLNDLSAPE
jgi:hypothetical protein